MNLRVKRLALFISFSTACLSSPSAVLAADPTADDNPTKQAERARPIRDRTPPVITLYGDNPMRVRQYESFTDPRAKALDNVDGPIFDIMVQGQVNMRMTGTYSLTYTARDRAGNTGFATRKVFVLEDNIPPILKLVGSSYLTIVQGRPFKDPGLLKSDNSGYVTVSASRPMDSKKLGEYVIIYTARDRAGNTSSVTRTVNVIARDTIAPIITLNGAATLEVTVGGTYTELGATATDNVDGSVTAKTSGKVNASKTGIYTVTYTAKDKAGNTSTKTRTVVVKAAINSTPIANAGAAQTVNEQTSVTLNGSATDSDGTIASYTWVQTGGSVVTLRNANRALATFTAPNIASDETLTFKLTVTDNKGASSSATTTITVKSIDSTKPIITLNGAASIELTVGDTYTDAGATATDNVDGTVTVTTTGSVNTATAGTYTLTYNAKDAAGNQATSVTRTVIVKPLANVAPTANAGADQTLNELSAVTLNGSGTDTDGTIASYAWTQTNGSSVTLANADQAQATFTAPDVTADTELSFKLTVTDDKGATAEDTVTITVKAVDSTKPVITLNGAYSVELNVGETYTDAGATASDDVDGTITVTTTGSVDTATAGTYTITYTAADAAGNTATATRTVIVKALPNQLPSASAGADQTVNEQAAVTLAGSGADTDGTIVSYVWTQISGMPVTLSNANTAQATFTAPDVTTDTELTFKLSVTDDKDATTEDTVTVTVKPETVSADTTPPVISLKGFDKIYHSFSPDYPDENLYEDQGATAIDNVDGEVAITKFGEVLNAYGTYTLNYTARDAANNEASKARIVKVVNSSPLYVHAGYEQTTMELQTITLDGSGSDANSDDGYEITSYEWTQTKGTPANLSNANSTNASFVAPDISVTETLEFTLTVTDNYGFKDSATTTVKVIPLLSPTPQTTGKVNDTGLTTCSDETANNLPCPVTTHPNQDAESGRDLTANDNLDGYAGFSFTKLDSNGVPLADQMTTYATTPWSCVKDNVTGLIWEVKTNDGGLHDVNTSYTAEESSGTEEICNLAGLTCTTTNYIEAVNNEGLCNANDWRLPTLDELFGLTVLDSSVIANNPTNITIDTNYFPHIIRSQDLSTYWTSDISYIQDQRYYSYFVNFKSGSFGFLYRSQQYGTLLVRGKQ